MTSENSTPSNKSKRILDEEEENNNDKIMNNINKIINRSQEEDLKRIFPLISESFDEIMLENNELHVSPYDDDFTMNNNLVNTTIDTALRDVRATKNPYITKREDKKKVSSNKYNDDIIQILKYAEENNPFSLILEVCQNLKWEHASIESFQMVENNINVYKSQIKLRQFYGEGVGITKKISRKKASVALITKMVEDKTIRDTYRIYISTKSITRDCKLNQENDDKEIDLDAVEFIKPVYKDSDLDFNRVKDIITEYNKSSLINPLSQLDSFRNKYNIPFCFTYTIKEKIHKAVLYVGGEIFAYGVDANIRVARYKAAEAGIKKIREKYGLESLKYKGLERRKNKLTSIEEEQKKKEHSINPIPCRVYVNIKSDEIKKQVNFLLTEESKLDKNIEIFFSKYERSLLSYNSDSIQIQKILALIFFSNQTLSIHFSNPILTGSFKNDCVYSLNPVVDIILYHEIGPNEMKEAIDNLIVKLKLILKEEMGEIMANISNRLNETNMEIMIRFTGKIYSFRLLIRDDEYKQFIYYIKVHNSKVSQSVEHPVVFNSLRRLFRVFRRQRKFIFIKPEVLDWMIKMFLSESLAKSLVKILRSGMKDFKKLFTNSQDNNANDVPEIIRREVESLDKLEIKNLELIMKELLDDIMAEDYKKIMNISN